MIQKKLQYLLSIATLLALSALHISAQIVPGISLPETAQTPISDQKTGSVLIYNYYTSDTANFATDTRISMTNNNPTTNILVHLYFVSNSCSVRNASIYLTRSQTGVFRASDFDPDTTGYLIAMAQNGSGEPINFNFLTGDAFVTTGSFTASLSAEAIGAITGNTGSAIVTDDDFDGAGTAVFGAGGQYGPLPRQLSISNFPSTANAQTLLIVNGISSGSSLLDGLTGAGRVFALVYNDIEAVASTGFNVPCQVARVLSNQFPGTAPPTDVFIPSGRSGWMRFYTSANRALLGAVIYSYPNGRSSGHNLHKLTYSGPISITLPIFP